MPDPKVLGLLTAVLFAMVPVILKLAFRRGGTTGVGMIIGLSVAVPANLLVLLVVRPDFAALTPFAIVAFGVAGLAGSGVGRRWNYNAIHLIGPSRMATIWTASPVFTGILAAVLYAEALTPLRWGAIAAIVAGAALVTWTPGSGARAGSALASSMRWARASCSGSDRWCSRRACWKPTCRSSRPRLVRSPPSATRW